jgi:hypothetical protein
VIPGSGVGGMSWAGGSAIFLVDWRYASFCRAAVVDLLVAVVINSRSWSRSAGVASRSSMLDSGRDRRGSADDPR